MLLHYIVFMLIWYNRFSCCFDNYFSLVCSAAQDGSHQDKGFSNSSYGMSKVGVTVMSMIQQRELDAAGSDDIVVNAVSCVYEVLFIHSIIG